ncbi:mitochondrial molecular chaperone Atp12 [Aspergillus udagawae]|uniref:Mitochondrial molecular chaperone Atp12 n=1 Tax=Aspergillus udagawae TaxID=91492 RepID=A0A8H3PE69_9EURO|nr:mitochondrial molecular chaperone Atp12 [Aspergillus udagawae]
MPTLPRAAFSVLSCRLISAVGQRGATTSCRTFHAISQKAAVAHPITAHGPPPKAPSPAPEFGRPTEEGKDVNDAGKPQAQVSKPSPTLEKRFWKNVDVRKKPGALTLLCGLLTSPPAYIKLTFSSLPSYVDGEYQVLLDTRPIRTPTKDILSVPSTKPHLAHAIALEWDVMTSARQALKNHLIPLTSLTARAGDIAQEDSRGETTTRDQIVKLAMRYLDTDTLLCWVPERNPYAGEESQENGERPESLREAQMRVAKDIIAFLGTKVWPGVDIVPILDADSILPVSQPRATKDIIKQWVSSLQPHDLAALERGIVASKSLLVAVRLVVEWSENFRHLQRSGQKKFGIKEAAEASSLEVRWQTDMWGEVEDTHDVDKEDLRRQLGSVIVVVSGETRE